jgi:hypothetical protein
MGIAESYSKATQSSNLKDDDHHHATEKLAAVALSSELGAKLFRVKYANDATSYNALRGAWLLIVEKKASLRQWPENVSIPFVTDTSLGYWLNDICRICEGKGALVIPGTPMLSDDPCPSCGGSGRKPLSCEDRTKRYVLDMIDILDKMTSISAGAAMRKLRHDMDF